AGPSRSPPGAIATPINMAASCASSAGTGSRWAWCWSPKAWRAPGTARAGAGAARVLPAKVDTTFAVRKRDETKTWSGVLSAPAHAVHAPVPRTGKDQIEEHEAVENGEAAQIGGREKAHRGMPHEIG